MIPIFTWHLCTHIIVADLYVDGLAQDCSNSSALTMELLQSCAKPLIFLGAKSTLVGIPLTNALSENEQFS